MNKLVDYLRVSKTGLVAAILLCLLFITGCKKDKDEEIKIDIDVSKIYIADISAETDWNYMLAGGDGSSAFVQLDKISSLPSQMFIKPDKNSEDCYAMFFSEDGLPQTMVVEDYIFYFANFRETKFDIAVICPDESIKYFFEVNSIVNWDKYTNISKKNQKSADDVVKGMEYTQNALGIIAGVGGIIDIPNKISAIGLTTTLISTFSKPDFVTKVILTSIGTAATVVGCGTAVTGLGAAVCVGGLVSLGSSWALLWKEAKEQLRLAEEQRPFLIVLGTYNKEMPFIPSEATVTVTTQSNWYIDNVDNGWCFVTKSSENTIKIYVVEENLASTRDCKVLIVPLVENNYVKPIWLTVTQLGNDYTISPRSLEFEAKGGKELFGITFSANSPNTTIESIVVVKGSNWCSIGNRYGVRPITVEVNTTSNNDASPRDALIEVAFKMGEYRTSTTVSVTQKGTAENSLPTISISNIAPYSATANVKINPSAMNLQPSETIHLVGVCYSESNSMPTISDKANYANYNSSLTSYNVGLSGLSPDTKYFVRGFVKTSTNNYIYGNVTSFYD